MRGHRTAGSLIVLAFMLGLWGCNGGKQEEFKTQEPGKPVAPAEVDHHHDYGPGPHEGRMTDLGQDHQYVVEITYTKEPRTIAVYVLDHHDTNKAVPIEAKSITLELHGEEGELPPVTLSAEPQEGEEGGKSSRFVVKGEAIPASIQDLEDIEGHLNVQMGEKTLEAGFEEEGHGDHHE